MTSLVEYMVLDAVIGDPDDHFFDGLSAALLDLARKGTALELIERDEKPSHIRLSWLDHRSGSAVRMWDDYRAMVRYLELRAPDASMMSRLRTALAQHLAPPKRADLVTRARRAPTDLAALMRVVYSAADLPDPETLVDPGVRTPSRGPGGARNGGVRSRHPELAGAQASCGTTKHHGVRSSRDGLASAQPRSHGPRSLR